VLVLLGYHRVRITRPTSSSPSPSRRSPRPKARPSFRPRPTRSNFRPRAVARASRLLS